MEGLYLIWPLLLLLLCGEEVEEEVYGIRRRMLCINSDCLIGGISSYLASSAVVGSVLITIHIQ